MRAARPGRGPAPLCLSEQWLLLFAIPSPPRVSCTALDSGSSALGALRRLVAAQHAREPTAGAQVHCALLGLSLRIVGRRQQGHLRLRTERSRDCWLELDKINALQARARASLSFKRPATELARGAAADNLESARFGSHDPPEFREARPAIGPVCPVRVHVGVGRPRTALVAAFQTRHSRAQNHDGTRPDSFSDGRKVSRGGKGGARNREVGGRIAGVSGMDGKGFARLGLLALPNARPCWPGTGPRACPAIAPWDRPAIAQRERPALAPQDLPALAQAAPLVAVLIGSFQTRRNSR